MRKHKRVGINMMIFCGVLQECLFHGLHSVADEDLPMLTSDFSSKHMLPAKADGTAFHRTCPNSSRTEPLSDVL